MYFYRHYFDLPLESEANLPVHFDYFINPMNFSKIALFGERTYEFLLNDFRDGNDISLRSDGCVNYGSEHFLLDRDAVGAARAHNISSYEKFYEKNLHEWELLIDEMKKRDISVAIVQLPTTKAYYENLDPKQFGHLQKMLWDLTERKQIGYFDYTREPGFGREDFSIMPDHLNTVGAEKISKIMDRDIVVPAFSHLK